jgi:hypothetical protein
MSYTVQFVGLVCFYRERGTRLALLPDGRSPGEGIDPHFGAIVVAADAVEEAVGWEGVEEAVGWEGVEEAVRGKFPLPPCELIIDHAAEPGTLDTSRHDGLLPQLRQLDSNFEIDPERAQTIAKVRIRRGTLTAHRIPGGTAAISQLDVPHDGSIRVTVRPDDGSPEKHIVVKPGTEIAVTNMASGNLYRRGLRGHGGNHFKIYERLSSRKVTLKEPEEATTSSSALPESLSTHVLFRRRGRISLYTNCSNTGCC